MHRHLYYDRDGNPVSAEDALDANQILREGFSQRTPLMMRDNQPDTHARSRARLVDSAKDPLQFSRPGYRIADQLDPNDQREQAYLDADEANASAYLGDRQKRKQKFDPQGREAGSEIITEEDDDPDENARSYRRILVTGGSGGSGLSLRSDDLDSVVELYTADDLRQLVVAAQTMPTLLRGLRELEDHSECGLVREATP